MNAVQPLPITGHNLEKAVHTRQSIHLELSFDLVDVLALLVCLRAALFRPSNLLGPLRDRMLGLHEFLLDQLPEQFRNRILASGALG